MFPFTKAKPKKNEQAEALLSRAEASVFRSFRTFIQQARNIEVEPLLERGDVDGVMRLLELPIQRFAASWVNTFVDIGTREAKNIELVQKAKKPVIAGVFSVGDPDAARIMQRASLNLIQNLTNQQREAVRSALTDGLRRGLGTKDLARAFRNSIGLTPQQQRSLEIFASAQRQARVDALRQGEELVSSDKQIDRLVERKAQQLLQQRAETIARTEALKITSQAREEALRQSVRAIGQAENLTGKEWVSVTDSRTREHHREANGQRRRLNEPFDVGGERLMKPGDGSPHNAISCRCSVIYFFADSEEEMERWLNGGS